MKKWIVGRSCDSSDFPRRCLNILPDRRCAGRATNRARRARRELLIWLFGVPLAAITLPACSQHKGSRPEAPYAPAAAAPAGDVVMGRIVNRTFGAAKGTIHSEYSSPCEENAAKVYSEEVSIRRRDFLMLHFDGSGKLLLTYSDHPGQVSGQLGYHYRLDNEAQTLEVEPAKLEGTVGQPISEQMLTTKFGRYNPTVTVGQQILNLPNGLSASVNMDLSSPGRIKSLVINKLAIEQVLRVRANDDYCEGTAHSVIKAVLE